MTRPTVSALQYHRATSYRRHGLTPHTLDWAHQPVPVKRYPSLPRVPLARDVALPTIDYAQLVAGGHESPGHGRRVLDHRHLAGILRLTHAVTARSLHGNQPFSYRSVASAGALYPCELYLAVNRVEGLDPGVYYHDLFDASLVALRQKRVPAIPSDTRGVAATCYISGIFFRSAWKYRARAYRYVLLDAGHLLENLRLALRAMKVPFSIHLDFDDDKVAHLLGLDEAREVCLACVHLYADRVAADDAGAAIDPPPLDHDIRRASVVSAKEVGYPAIVDVHRAGQPPRHGRDDEARTATAPAPPTTWIELDPPGHLPAADYVTALSQRRSRRNFVPVPIEPGGFTAMTRLVAASMGPPSGMPTPCHTALTTGWLIGEDMPVAPGYYCFDPATHRLGRIREGPLIDSMAAACLDQMWLKYAGLHLLFTADLNRLDRCWGARGYRYAMIEAGRLGQQAYLSATILGWGACGIGAIYDREAADLLHLAPDQALLYLIGVGAVKKR